MLLRRSDDGIVAITQPAHAWLSGVMTRARGNARFKAPRPGEDVCLAAGLHDIGWLARDHAPPFDQDTGLPVEFWDVLATEHTKIWAQGVRHAGVYSTYAAILVSLHGDTIYDKTFDPATARPENAAAVVTFRATQQAFRTSAITALRHDPSWVAALSDERLGHNKLILAAVDTLSLNLCWGVTKPVTIKDVPLSAVDRTTLTLVPTADGVGIDPWPFGTDQLTLPVEGRSIKPGQDLDGVWERAARLTITTVLHPL